MYGLIKHFVGNLAGEPGLHSFWDRVVAFFSKFTLHKMEVDAGMQLAVALFVMFTGALAAGALPWMVQIKDSQLR